MSYTDKQRIRIMNLLETIMSEATGGNADYAKSYALTSIEAYYMYGDRGLQMQLPYVLSNLQHWRGDLARQTKEELKSYWELVI